MSSVPLLALLLQSAARAASSSGLIASSAAASSQSRRTDLGRASGNEWVGSRNRFFAICDPIEKVARTFRHAMRPPAPRVNTPCGMQW